MELSNALSNLKSLTLLQLYFNENKITDRGLFELSKFFKCLKQLSQLHLFFRANYISDKGIGDLSRELFTLQTLSEMTLVFDENKITDAGINELSKFFVLTNIPKLQLSFQGNQISFEVMKRIESFGKPKS